MKEEEDDGFVEVWEVGVAVNPRENFMVEVGL